jgi:hypothetical protein
MSAVTRFFFRSPATDTTSLSIVQWWESRRMAFNAAVGAAGLLTLATFTLVSALPPMNADIVVPWEPVALYAVAANVCYTLGPVLDLIVCRRWGSAYAAVGPALFRYGFAFSIGLTLLPIPLLVGVWCVSVARTILVGA